MTIYCMHLVIIVKRHLQQKFKIYILLLIHRKNISSLDFAMTASLSVEDFCPFLKKLF